MKILIVSDLSVYALANSYIRAAKASGHEVEAFDLKSGVNEFARFGAIGKKINVFWPVNAWIRKANRKLAILFKNFRPDTVIVFGDSPVMVGTLAFFKSISKAKLVLYWPDTFLNIEEFHISASRMYDQVATYSQRSIPVFRRLGFTEGIWAPFAGDIEFLKGETSPSQIFQYDLTFAGGWRPERERTVSQIIHQFPNLKVFVRGAEWERNCKDEKIKKILTSESLFGAAFGDFFRTSRINLNVIDDTNYPAANMRFFEIPASGGLQLSSACPEMEEIFIDKQHILYFEKEKELYEKIQFVIDNPLQAQEIRHNAFQLIKESHSYANRINDLINLEN